jgi:hypothetical protein
MTSTTPIYGCVPRASVVPFEVKLLPSQKRNERSGYLQRSYRARVSWDKEALSFSCFENPKGSRG